MNTMKVDKSNEAAGACGGNFPQLKFPKAFPHLAHLHLRFPLPLLNANPSSFKTHLQNALSTLQTHANHAITNLVHLNSHNHPLWARIAQGNNSRARPMSAQDIEERLAGVPVYALSNAAEEFVLVSGGKTKNLGLFCFKKEDAEALLEQVATVDPQMRQGSKVVPVALDKVFQLKVNGVAFRLIPEYSQVKNALSEKERSGFYSKGFSGVPVFQSKSLILKSQNKRYRPLFFRKEDLENSLQRAAHQQNQLNPALRQGDIQVAVLEDVIKEMKENSTSNWDDVIFIPPGFDVSTDPNQQ